MVVLKFGGTSVQDAPAMNQALDITVGYLDRSPVLVSSAMSGVTNDLVALAGCLKAEDEKGAQALLEKLTLRHFQVLEDVASVHREEGRRLLQEILGPAEALVRGALLLRECSPRVEDAIAALGELLSTTLLYVRCLERGIPAQLLDSRKLVITDDHFGSAQVLWPQTNAAIQAGVKPQKGKILIAQGFIGATDRGVTTVLGRGGSDYSGAIFGAALEAEEVQIWTDVNGIMTTDPRKVPRARSIPQITYTEAAELAYFGAKVVHPATIQPAVEKAIPVWVKNTKNPSHPGTAILAKAPGVGLRAIAGKKGLTLVTVTSGRMLNAFGFLSRIFEIFNRFQTPVDLVATSEVSVSMTIEDSRNLGAITEALEELGTVKVDGDCGILCLVGLEVWKQTPLIQRVFAALGTIPVKMISLGSSEVNLSLVVNPQDLDAAIQRIHQEFFPE